jgi:hypothetical protein
MKEYLSQVNAGVLYLIVGLVLAFITVMCLVFLIKSYRAGIKIGMDKAVLRKVIISSATFTLLPSISILLGVIALSGSLGVPFSWLRLSVIGALQYELNVADMAAQGIGLEGVKAVENIEQFSTIALVMTACILGGVVCCLFFLKAYRNKLQKAPKKEASGKPGFGAHATTAMFVGLCGAYIGAYVGEAFVGKFNDKDILVKDTMPLVVALIAAAAMAVFEYFVRKKGKTVLDNFSLAASMLIAMAGAVLIGMM